MNAKPLRRLAFLVGLACGPVVAFVAACNDDDAVEGGPDATTEGQTPEGGADGAAPDGTADGGNCTAVTGACDLVLQDCPPGSRGEERECVVARTSGVYATECRAVQPSQQLPRGRACCSNAGQNPCLPGLSCIGSPCVDGGPATGRCSPACCIGDDKACGRSDPEGIAGHCDITLFDTESDTELHPVCSYRERCKPFRQEPCKPDQMCQVEDKVGSASCITTFDKGLGEACGFANDCGDGLFCLDTGAGGVCRMMCLTPNAVHPFDASVEDGGPFTGGCPPNEACDIGPFLENLPAWLSFCRLDGG
jgi:hypothetical protein